MDTLHDRLAELADQAPTGGAPAAQLWARGKRLHRLRAAAVAATLLVLGAVGTGIGVGLISNGDGNRSGVGPAGTEQAQIELGFSLPIEYPIGEDLPDLGDTPGPLAAVWSDPGDNGGAPEVVGLVGETGTFGTLPIQVSFKLNDPFDAAVALSPDGRRIAYAAPTGELVVRDLVSGERYLPVFEFGFRTDYTWIDATHLVGHVAEGSDLDGWVWEPGTEPKLVDLRTYPGSPWLGPYAGKDPWFIDRGTPHTCVPTFQDREGPSYVLVLCNVAGMIGPDRVLTHDGNARVVSITRPTDEFPFQDPAPPSPDPATDDVVETAGSGALMRVAFATDLIAEALDPGGAP